MAEQFLQIRGLEPLLFRDARPFTNEIGGLTARSLPLPLPQTLSGFVRARIGEAWGARWNDNDFVRDLHGIPVGGPLLVRSRAGAEEVLLPAPRDAVVAAPRDGAAGADDVRTFALRPWKDAPPGGGSDLPEGLLPLRGMEMAGKPAGGYLYWPWPQYADWLAFRDGAGIAAPEKISGLPREERVHNGIDENTGRSEDGKLFSVEYAAFDGKCGESWSLLARVKLPEDHPFPCAGSFGGERRLAEARLLPQESRLWPGGEGKQRLRDALRGAARVRMTLVTPALFTGGWRPGWLDADPAETNRFPRGLSGLRLRLVAAAVGRREPVSGWGVRENVPRPVRWAIPAGSTYFFEVQNGGADASSLVENTWLRPVSDIEQDRKDGFGLAVWGIW